MPKIFVNGEEMDITGEEYEELYPPLTNKQQLLKDAPQNITTAPKTGFSGPTGKELFNGNR